MLMIAFWIFAGSAGLLLGIIVHELGHALVALAVGWQVHGISRSAGLLSLGLDLAAPLEEVRVARQKYRAIALAGPAANLIAGGLLCSTLSPFSNHAQLSNSQDGLLMTLGLVQLALGISNLIPRKKGTALGNDGDIVFRVCRTDATYKENVTDR